MTYDHVVDGGTISSSFHVVPASVVSAYLADRPDEVLRLVEETLLAHDAGRTVNPDSQFLRFPGRPEARIIALPSYLSTGKTTVAGIKWISSWPANIERGLARASAVLILNDIATGHPIALLEASGISAARTAAGAAIAARTLLDHAPSTAAVLGAGVIARTIVDYLAQVRRLPARVVVHDPDEASAAHLVEHLRGYALEADYGELGTAMAADLVVLATNVATPFIDARTPLRPGQVVLNVSLRDLAPDLLVDANNLFDDVEHCMKAQTSPHLLEQRTGGRDFVTGTLADVLLQRVEIDRSRPTVFSPFGLGVLDLALGAAILEDAVAHGAALELPEFLGAGHRWIP